MTSKKSTMVELPAELEALNYLSPGMYRLLLEAKAGEFHDYKNQKYACGKVAVVGLLADEASLPRTPRAVKDALKAIRQRVINGEFDEQADEADKAMMRKELPESAWDVLGLRPKEGMH